MMTRQRWRAFSQGWWPMGDRSAMPSGTLRRAEGVNSIRTGTLRSRYGATQLYALAAHSLYRFRDVRFQGAGNVLYRNGVAAYGAFNGDRLTFARMPPTPGKEDYLFVAGGGALIKVSPDGVLTRWGIEAPEIDPVLAVGAAGALTGTYLGAVTFKNSITGSRSNPNPATFETPVSVTVTADRIEWSNIPTSLDPQVDTRELWRTAADGAIFFKLTEIADNTTTTFSDNIVDADLEDETLPLDNTPPDADFNDAIGPYAGRMFWSRIGAAGSEGRVYYSPIGRPESVAGFIEINNGDDPVQRLIFWGGSLYAWTNGQVIQIIGQTEPFTWRGVFGCPGTSAPFTVTPTPFGVYHQSIDGIRLFNGTRSDLVGFEAIGRLLTGESLEGIAAFNPVIAAYTGREVWFSDTTTVLMLDVATQAWRYVIAPVTALYFEPDTRVLVGGSSAGSVFLPEPVGVTTDNGIAIPFEVETPSVMTDVSVEGLVVRLFFDVDTGGNLLTPTLVLDNAEVALPPFTTSTRPDPPIEIEVGRWGHVIGVRLEGSVTTLVTVYGVEMDLYVPGASA